MGEYPPLLYPFPPRERKGTETQDKVCLCALCILCGSKKFGGEKSWNFLTEIEKT